MLQKNPAHSGVSHVVKITKIISQLRRVDLILSDLSDRLGLLKKGKLMSDYLDYLDEIYEELVDEFGHEAESNCIHDVK